MGWRVAPRMTAPENHPTTDPRKTHPDPHSTVPTTPLVQDNKCTTKRELNYNHILGIKFHFYVSLPSKYRKHACVAISRRKTRTVSVCVKYHHTCIATCFRRDPVSLSLHFQFTAPSRGKALSVDFFTPLLPTTTNREQPKSARLTDYLKCKNTFTFIYKGDAGLLPLF